MEYAVARGPTVVNCPTCGKPVEWNAANRWRPFCSERCRLADLAGWMDEERRIPGDCEGREWELDGPDDP